MSNEDPQLNSEDQQMHVYLLLNGWRYEKSRYGGTFYVAPFQTMSLIFGLHIAFSTHKKWEAGESVEYI